MTIKQHILFRDLREANLKRIPLLKNAKGNPVHSKPDGSDWPLSLWLTAFNGEFGEYCSLFRRYSMGEMSPTEFRSMVSGKLADMIICLDIILMHQGYDEHLPEDLDDYITALLEPTNDNLILKLLWDFGCVADLVIKDDSGKISDYLLAYMLQSTIALFDVNHIQRSPAIIHRFNHVSEQQGIEVYL